MLFVLVDWIERRCGAADGQVKFFWKCRQSMLRKVLCLRVKKRTLMHHWILIWSLHKWLSRFEPEFWGQEKEAAHLSVQRVNFLRRRTETVLQHHGNKVLHSVHIEKIRSFISTTLKYGINLNPLRPAPDSQGRGWEQTLASNSLRMYRLWVWLPGAETVAIAAAATSPRVLSTWKGIKEEA